MNVLFLTIGSIENLDGNGLYIDLINEMKDQNNNVYIVCPNEKRTKRETEHIENGKIRILRVKTGNITKTNFFEKGISTLLIESQFIKAINKYYKNVKFDLILYTTPPVTFEKVIRYFKKRDNSLTYLILKDIFPQNAVDLGLMSKNGIIFRYFRFKEKKLYAISDYIGCTSQENINYILLHNPEIDASRVELFPNSIRPRKLEKRVAKREKLREKYNIPINAVVFVYGGNIGKPQGIDFLMEVLKRAKQYPQLFIMILGSGTEFNRLSSYIKNLNLSNVNIARSIPQAEYWEFLSCCDVGLIFLDKRFTVPNTPARLTYYMEAAIPVLAATDKNTDINKILAEAECGFWVEAGKIDKYFELVEKLLDDEDLRKQLGVNGRLYLENNLTIDKNYEILEAHFNDRRKENVQR